MFRVSKRKTETERGKSMKNKEKLLKKEQNRETNIKIGQRLDDLIDSKYKKYTDFIIALNGITGYPTDKNAIVENNCFINKATLSKILKGERAITPDESKKISELLGVSIDYLLCRIEYPTYTEDSFHRHYNKELAYNNFLKYIGIDIQYRDNDGLYYRMPEWDKDEYRFIDNEMYAYIQELIFSHTRILFKDFASCGISLVGSKGALNHIKEKPTP